MSDVLDRVVDADDVAADHLDVGHHRLQMLAGAHRVAETALERSRRIFGRDHPMTKSYQDVLEAISAMIHLDRP